MTSDAGTVAFVAAESAASVAEDIAERSITTAANAKKPLRRGVVETFSSC
jgi:hypothetical protein